MAKDEKSQTEKDDQTIRNLRRRIEVLERSQPEIDVAKVCELILAGKEFEHAFVQHQHSIGDKILGNDPMSTGNRHRSHYYEVAWRVFVRQADGELADRTGPRLYPVVKEVLDALGAKMPDGLESLIEKIEP